MSRNDNVSDILRTGVPEVPGMIECAGKWRGRGGFELGGWSGMCIGGKVI